MRWALEGLLANELSGRQIHCELSEEVCSNDRPLSAPFHEHLCALLPEIDRGRWQDVVPE